MTFFSKLGGLFRRQKLNRELSEEIRAHLDALTEQNIARGMSPVEARHAAHRIFRGEEQVKERVRDEWSWIWLEQLMQDVRLACRGLRRNPGFTVIAVLTLAFGLGINTSMFSGLQAVLSRDLP